MHIKKLDYFNLFSNMAMLILYLAIFVTFVEIFYAQQKKVKKYCLQFLHFTGKPEWREIEKQIICNKEIPPNTIFLEQNKVEYYLLMPNESSMHSLSSNNQCLVNLKKFTRLKRKLEKKKIIGRFLLTTSFYYLVDQDVILRVIIYG